MCRARAGGSRVWPCSVSSAVLVLLAPQCADVWTTSLKTASWRWNNWRLLACIVKKWAVRQAELVCALAHALGAMWWRQMMFSWCQHSCECLLLQRKPIPNQLWKQDALQWGSPPVPQNWQSGTEITHPSGTVMRMSVGCWGFLFLCSNTLLHIVPWQSYSQKQLVFDKGVLCSQQLLQFRFFAV